MVDFDTLFCDVIVVDVVVIVIVVAVVFVVVSVGGQCGGRVLILSLVK